VYKNSFSGTFTSRLKAKIVGVIGNGFHRLLWIKIELYRSILERTRNDVFFLIC
jgi:hypothetical protein